MKFLRPRKGQGMVEYGLFALAIVVIITLALFGANNPVKIAVIGAFNRTADRIHAHAPSPPPHGGS